VLARVSLFGGAIGVAVRKAKRQLGVGEARNRVERTVERTGPPLSAQRRVR
jgi:hypothetical protein